MASVMLFDRMFRAPHSAATLRTIESIAARPAGRALEDIAVEGEAESVDLAVELLLPGRQRRKRPCRALCQGRRRR
jgi:hypothetical protein